MKKFLSFNITIKVLLAIRTLVAQAGTMFKHIIVVCSYLRWQLWPLLLLEAINWVSLEVPRRFWSERMKNSPRLINWIQSIFPFDILWWFKAVSVTGSTLSLISLRLDQSNHWSRPTSSLRVFSTSSLGLAQLSPLSWFLFLRYRQVTIQDGYLWKTVALQPAKLFVIKRGRIWCRAPRCCLIIPDITFRGH